MPKAKLNLSKGFDPLKNETIVELIHEFLIFPGGEPHIKLKNVESFRSTTGNDIVITARITNSEEMIKLMLAKDAADRTKLFDKSILFLPYFPGGRQDRVCVEGEAFSAGVYASMINSLKFDEVIIATPHSDVSTALLENVTLYDMSPHFLEAARDIIFAQPLNALNIICPDAGAGKRVQDIAKLISNALPGFEISFVRCEKVRDVKDGKLKEFYADTSSIIEGAPMLIFDDIVAYGGTFIGLADVLRKNNPRAPLGIFITHADCLSGLLNLANSFDRIYATDSRDNWDLTFSSDGFLLLNLSL